MTMFGVKMPLKRRLRSVLPGAAGTPGVGVALRVLAGASSRQQKPTFQSLYE